MMIKMKIKKLMYLLAFTGLFGLLSCSSNDGFQSTLHVKLVDAPADYEAVNIEVLSVSINYGSENEESGWTDLETNSGIYNLLDLTAGNEVLLVSNEVPSATISQIRLLLGDNNSVVVDGEIFSLKTPSGQQSGVKLNLQQSFEEGIDYTILLDFDAAKSVVDNPVKYILKPVIRASMEALNGAIKGMVNPSDANAVIYAIQEEDTVASTYPNDEGMFMLRGIEEGVYTVSIDLPDDDLFVDEVIEDVNVNIGEITDLETINLEEK